MATEEEHALCILGLPEDAIALHPQVDDPSNGAFNGAAAQGDACLLELVISQSVCMLFQVVDLLADLGCPSSATKAFQVGKHQGQLPFFEAFALLVEPGFALFLGQVPAGIQGRVHSRKNGKNSILLILLSL